MLVVREGFMYSCSATDAMINVSAYQQGRSCIGAGLFEEVGNDAAKCNSYFCHHADNRRHIYRRGRVMNEIDRRNAT